MMGMRSRHDGRKRRSLTSVYGYIALREVSWAPAYRTSNYDVVWYRGDSPENS